LPGNPWFSLTLLPVAVDAADMPAPAPPRGEYTIPEPAPKAQFYPSVSPRQMLELLGAPEALALGRRYED
jgi:hypothetical protein